MFKKQIAENYTIWFGGELIRPMELGRVKRTLAGILLKFVASFGRGMHASFGDNGIDDRPHICSPLNKAIDRCICATGDRV
jgi:hypothetical protein